MVNPTLYDILGVSPQAGRDEIKRGWRDAADRFEPGSGGSSAQFRMFNEAAEVLLEPARRKAYDAELADRAPVETVPGPSVSPPATDESLQSTHGEGEATKQTRPRRRVPVAALAVLGLLAAVALGSAIYLGIEQQRASAHAEALSQAPSAAERAAAAVLSYDYESLEADRDAAAKFLTSDYRKDYVKTFELVQGNAPALKAKVEAKVLASSAMTQTGDRDPERVPVLLFVDQTTLSTANSGEPSVALNRVRLDMLNVDGTWLVDGITSY